MQNSHPHQFFLHCRWQTLASGVDAVVLHTTSVPLFISSSTGPGETLPDQGISLPTGGD